MLTLETYPQTSSASFPKLDIQQWYGDIFYQSCSVRKPSRGLHNALSARNLSMYGLLTNLYTVKPSQINADIYIYNSKDSLLGS